MEKQILLGLLIFVMLCVLVVAGLFAWQYYAASNSSSPTTAGVPVSTPVAAQTCASTGGTTKTLVAGDSYCPSQTLCGVQPEFCQVIGQGQTMQECQCPSGACFDGQKCVLSSPPSATGPDTSSWKTVSNATYGFSLKYPDGFFDAGHQPVVLTGPCASTNFPQTCPNINKILTQNNDLGDYQSGAVGNALTINNNSYCLYQLGDAAMGHTYSYYYYVAVKNNQCLVATFATSAANCDFYLPLEPGNTQQAQNYQTCLTTNQNQPTILNQIVNTFTFAP